MVESQYKIKFTPIANEDLDDIYNYITNELFNNIAAEKILDEYRKENNGIKVFSVFM